MRGAPLCGIFDRHGYTGLFFIFLQSERLIEERESSLRDKEQGPPLWAGSSTGVWGKEKVRYLESENRRQVSASRFGGGLGPETTGQRMAARKPDRCEGRDKEDYGSILFISNLSNPLS